MSASPVPAGGGSRPRRLRLWTRWTVAFTVGELVGFGLLPAAGGLVAMSATASLAPTARTLILYLVAVLGGLGEGAVLARFQLHVLPFEVDRGRWTRHTAVAASAAWALGMLPPTLDDLFGISTSLQIALWVFASVVILLSIGGVQARLLRGLVRKPSHWLWANVVGWLGGLPWTFVLPMLLPDTAPPLVFGVAFFLGGILMGATTGAITGLMLVRMVGEKTG